MQLVCLDQGQVIVKKLLLAQGFSERFWGLMGTRELDPQAGLLLTPCSAIHTWFMRFPLDVIFLDQEWKIVKIVEKLPPFQAALGGIKARLTLELPGGRAREAKLVLGQQLALLKKSNNYL